MVCALPLVTCFAKSVTSRFRFLTEEAIAFLPLQASFCFGPVVRSWESDGTGMSSDESQRSHQMFLNIVPY